MMKEVSIALAKHLSILPNSPLVIAENSQTIEPVEGELFLTERTIFGRTFGLELNSTKQQRFGTYEITIYAPKGTNKFDTLDEATSIVTHFYRGLRLEQDGFEVNVDENTLGNTFSDENYHILPIFISFWFYA